MALPTVTRTVFDRSLKLARAPFDAALGVAGRSDSSARRAGSPTPACGGSPRGRKFAAAHADTIVVNATTEPTDRSMPPVRITKVTPMLNTPVIEAYRTILSRFSTFVNRSPAVMAPTA